MAFEAIVEDYEKTGDGHFGQTTTSETRRLDYIYDNEPLGFEKYLIDSTKNM